MSVKPYKNSKESKKRQVEKMFDNISGKYDFLNHSLSLNLDRIWRKKAITLLKGTEVSTLLDVATGTGDMITPALKLKPEKIVGLDLSEGMLQIARTKFPGKAGNTQIEFIKGDSENLPFDNEQFDAETVAFGVRNFENTLKGLKEMHRVLRPGGKVVILEFSKPAGFPFRNIYRFYFKNLLPLFGRMISKDKEAYTYLPESVDIFPERENFVNIMEEAGFRQCSFKPLTFGVCTVYSGIRPKSQDTQ
jgi:demethylmenaquinone methyltransferase / 2-methoxy-6-polyprenyl-1,4-benzoquinol methylase